MHGRYFEDFHIGDVIQSEGATLTESQILDFALRFDPQPFHLDAVAAADGPFQGLIASGFHTLSLTFRLLRDTGVITGTSLGGSGLDDLRWLKPVRPGDTIRVRAEVAETKPSRRGDRGTVRLAYTTLNQRGEPVMTCTMNHILATRSVAV
ncbi:MaoC family dehydratase [Azospirillum picis]|uniref:Acyl dehydratase n=1 Tax=Azospirillum picis TaxID=488438 RepID=A0ABU0MHA5_9PROT|nr:MaoC family dehydratase [Azospirillum picis]MBP2298933.1 acyl dehydratase [Azospirillum picis]MDQ0532825.1 acyl dehydratase [Azospirillum picis]